LARQCFALLYLQSAVRSHSWPCRTIRFAVYTIPHEHVAYGFRKLPFRNFIFRRLPITCCGLLCTPTTLLRRPEQITNFQSSLTHHHKFCVQSCHLSKKHITKQLFCTIIIYYLPKTTKMAPVCSCYPDASEGTLVAGRSPCHG